MPDQIFVYLDEGALDRSKDEATGKEKPAVPSVAAVVLDNPDQIRDSIKTLERRLLLDPSFRSEGNASRFETDGFHHTYDPIMARLRFVEAISKMTFSWYSSALIDVRPKRLYRSIEKQYVQIIRTIAQKFRDNHISFVFEQNTALNNKYASLVEEAISSVSGIAPTYEVSIAGKEERLLALPDYCIAIAADAIRGWKDACCDLTTLSRDHTHRTFTGIESKCSLLFAFDFSRPISNRESRLQERTYESLTGHHSDRCTALVESR